MALHLIIGASGTGKSRMLYSEMIRQSVANPGGKFIIIVPEQYTMAVQKELIRLHPEHTIMQIDILSFQRLANRVFAELGLDGQPVLDDTGKNLIIRKIMEDNKEKLNVFAGNLNKTGFVSEVKSVISELLQYSIAPSDMPGIIESVSKRPALAGKLSDIQTVYKLFMDYIEEKYITKEGILGVLADNVHSSELLNGSVIALDGFTGFTPVQYKLIRRIAARVSDIYVTVTADGREKLNVQNKDENLFALSKETMASLLRIADEQRIETAPYVICDKPYRFASAGDIQFLADNVFRYTGAVYKEEPQNIAVYCGENPKDEIKYAAAKILELTRRCGMRYRDIAIVSTDIEGYGDLAANIFKQNNIPVFVDYKRSILGNPMIEFIRSAIAVIESNYSYESVFRLLRTGITGINNDDIDILENYCLALGIRGSSKWHSQWSGRYLKKGRNSADLGRLNELRHSVVAILKPLETVYSGAANSTAEVSLLLAALREFIEAACIEQKLLARADELDAACEPDLAAQYRQIHGKVLQLFDEINELFGMETMNRKEFAKLLDAGLEEIKIGLIPPTADCVLVGDMERTRLDNIKALFFVGVNDGLVPKRTVNKGILSELDRYALAEANVTLSPDAKKQAYIDRFYLYINLAKPSEKLFITYAAVDSDGKSIRPSYVIHTLSRMFPELRINFFCAERDMWLTIPKARLQWRERDRRVMLGGDMASELYGCDIRESVTRLEQFASCEFAHFLKYGLELEEREEYKINAADTGSLLHRAVERISSELIKGGRDFTALNDAERKELAGRIVNDVAEEYGNAVFKASSRNEYILEKIKELTDRTIWAIGKQLESERFVPESFEVRFSLPMRAVDSTHSVELVGVIDRIDVCEDEENVYVKVVDYKTGNEKFSLYKTYYGLKLQLMTYMMAALDYEERRHPGKKAVPAGMFYFVADNPIVDMDRDDAAVEAKLLKELSYDGLVNKLLPENIMGSNTDNIKSDAHITARQFESLSTHLSRTMNSMALNMVKGSADINPVEDGGTASCRYCQFRAVCGFYSDIPGNSYRRVRHMKDSEIWEKLSDNADDNAYN